MNALVDLYAAWHDASPVARACIDPMRAHKHGDLPRWLAALDSLPEARPSSSSAAAVVSVGEASDVTEHQRRRLVGALRTLRPWRKGPFRLFGIDIDAEWRCERKWARIAPHVNLQGRRVLDVGCGNGYYGWRMLAAGAESVTGIDPSPLFVLQHAAVSRYLGYAGNLVLPLRLEDLAPGEPFDAVFSMGVVYHRRDGARHVRELAEHAREGTLLVLESLVVDGAPLVPRGRYARMRNVHMVPNVATLLEWLEAAGFVDSVVVDIAATTVEEQRTTAWMPFQSLACALDPERPTRTVEGYPAPQRAIIMARR